MRSGFLTVVDTDQSLIFAFFLNTCLDLYEILTSFVIVSGSSLRFRLAGFALADGEARSQFLHISSLKFTIKQE
jgi:hypothetical protein